MSSPPYYGLRDYGIDGQIGLEESSDKYIKRLVAVFREVRRVLKNDGTLWVNIGDSYAGSWGNYSGQNRGRGTQRARTVGSLPTPAWDGRERQRPSASRPMAGIKNKDLIGIPWMLAFALRADGWYLRSEIIWHKPNPMPESVKDRPTKAHEQIFLLSKSPKYYYDHDAIAEAAFQPTWKPCQIAKRKSLASLDGHRETLGTNQEAATRNKRSVWNITTKPFKGAHFAVFPPELPETCLLAGSPDGGVVLDPFSSSGTTGFVAVKNGRSYIGIELNPEYVAVSEKRYKHEVEMSSVGLLNSRAIATKIQPVEAAIDSLFE